MTTCMQVCGGCGDEWQVGTGERGAVFYLTDMDAELQTFDQQSLLFWLEVSQRWIRRSILDMHRRL